MTSDDWKPILTAAKPMLMAVVAAIGSAGTVLAAGGHWQTACGAAFCSFSAIYLEILRRRSDQAVVSAQDAKEVAAGTRTLINGRMDELLKNAEEKGYARGRADGIASTAKAMGDNPLIPADQQEVLKTVAKATKPDGA